MRLKTLTNNYYVTWINTKAAPIMSFNQFSFRERLLFSFSRGFKNTAKDLCDIRILEEERDHW